MREGENEVRKSDFDHLKGSFPIPLMLNLLLPNVSLQAHQSFPRPSLPSLPVTSGWSLRAKFL